MTAAITYLCPGAKAGCDEAGARVQVSAGKSVSSTVSAVTGSGPGRGAAGRSARALPASRVPARTGPYPVTPDTSAGVVRRCGSHACPAEGCSDDERQVVRRSAVDGDTTRVPPIVADVLSRPGHPLDPATRSTMEGAFGQDFSQVRVHSDPAAAESALAVRANAYTLGRDVVFGGGKYAPGTLDGDRLVAHELTHVAQQGGRARVRPSSLRLGEPSDHAEREAQQAAGYLAGGGRPALRPAASGIQRDELTEEEQRQLAASSCPSGRCHAPVRPSAFRAPFTTGDPGSPGAPGSFATSPADMAALRQWVEGQNRPVQQDEPAPEAAGATGAAAQPLPVMKPPADLKAPPGIAQLGSRRKVIHVVEVFVPETRFASPAGPWGSNRVLSQADVVAQYDVEINQPDPTAGHNFDTYLWNVTSNRRIPAQWLGGTRFRVFMGTPECPGCHFGRGLEIDLKGQSFAMAMAQGLMEAAALSGMAGMGAAAAEADEAALAAQTPAARTPDDEYNDFLRMLRDEGATEFNAAGEPITMQPHGGAREARATLGVTGEHQSMHGLPRSVGKHMPGYDPDAALTTLGDKALHTEMDQPWKDAFQNMRRQGHTTASAQEIYDAVADSIERSPQLSPGLKDTMRLRLHDEMFVEYGLPPDREMTLPYPNIKPRP